MTASPPSLPGQDRTETVSSTSPTLSSAIVPIAPSSVAFLPARIDIHLNTSTNQLSDASILLNEESATSIPTAISRPDFSADGRLTLASANMPSSLSSPSMTINNTVNNEDSPLTNNVSLEIESAVADIIPGAIGNGHTLDSVETSFASSQGEADSTSLQPSEGALSTHSLDSTLMTTILSQTNHQSTHLPSDIQEQISQEDSQHPSLAQRIASPNSPTESTMTTPTTIVVTPSESEDTPIAAGSARNSTSSLRSRLREIPPPIGLPPRLNSHEAPMFTSSDEPPPYSPTHTILPHYFELEPIPVRTYIIKDSTGLPCLFDFWLISTTQSSSSRPQSLLLVQDRGLSPQHQAELKYSIIRPQHTDRTAFPVTGATDTYFSPALALVAARYPSRWIWWGTEALQMVVFGRQLKNIIMEWRWRHRRTRIGGPVVHQLIGCCFQITPDRRFCWRAGSGRSRTIIAHQARIRLQQQHNRNSAIRNTSSVNNSNNDGSLAVPSTQHAGRVVEERSGGWFGGLFGRSRRSSGLNTEQSAALSSPTDDVALSSVHIHRLLSESLSASPEIVIQDNLPLSEQESAMDNAIDAAAATGAVEDGDNVDDDDDEAGFYHCREESSTGFLGRIVAVYKPGRPANRARDRPASSRKLEIFTEVGERCETALMLMCTRLDDLFMSLPVQKREQMFVTSRAGAGHSSGSRDGTASGGQSLSTAAGVNGNVFDGSNEPTEGEQERGDGLDLGGQDRHGQTSAPTFSVLLKKRLVGTPRDWLFRFKWIIAAILITVVLVLVLKPKHPPHD